VAPKAPHSPATPAPRHVNTFNGVKAPRLPSFNEVDVTDKPPWIKSLPKLTSNNIANIDKRHENRIESLQALDDLVADVVLKLGEKPDVLSNTYIFFTSDNGFHHGEHRIPQGKGRPYEESVRMPLVIRGPDVVPPAAGQPRLSTDKLVVNTDYFPTFMELARAQTLTPSYVDGRSLLPVLKAPTTTSWRTAILIEGRKFSEDPEIPVDVNYNAIRTSTDKYIEYEGGFRELYDLSPGADPNELTNTYYSAGPTVSPRPERKARLDALRTCQPQDDKTTPEVEIPCRTAEDAP
jgi:N-acetylglucosamine-6-sulfatase